MVNEILMRGATPIAMPQPVEGAQPIVSDPPAGGDDFAKVLLAEMDGPAPAAMKGAGAAPAVAPPPAITLETIPVVPPPMIAPPARSAPPALAPEGGGTYTVQQGDSLSKIARKLGHSNWRALYAENRTIVGANPNMIHPGQVLSLPATWQAAAADTTRVAQASRTVIEPPAKLPATPVAPVEAPVDANTAGTVAAPEAKAPTLTPPVVPIEASQEPMPAAPVAPVAGPVSAAPADPTPADIASEAIDRLTAEPNGSADHVATLREALKSIPPGSASYDAYRAKVEAYEAAVGQAPLAAAPAVPMAPPVAPNVPMTPLDQAPPASDPVGGAGFAPPAPAPGFAPPAPAGFVPPAPAEAYGPSGPGGTEAPIIHAEAAPPAAAAVAPAPDVPAAPAEGATADGEEDWQAFS